MKTAMVESLMKRYQSNLFTKIALVNIIRFKISRDQKLSENKRMCFVCPICCTIVIVAKFQNITSKTLLFSKDKYG